MRHHRWLASALAALLGLTIVAANWAIGHVGDCGAGVCVLPAGFGLVAPSGAYVAGLAFTFRDLLHETGGRAWVIGAILAGALLSALLSGPLAVASGAAFLISELADLVVYERVRGRSWLAAIALSNTVGAALDSAVFLLLAFGSLAFVAGQTLAKLWSTLPVLVALWWRRAPLGSKSLLLGAHQFVLHPFFLAVAWVRLYGVPPMRDWLPLAVAFAVHDWGYWQVRAMDDGPADRQHPVLGGRIMARLFGEDWGAFTRLHSRQYADIEGVEPSPLCAADKLTLLITPRWLYLPLVWITGEAQDYQERFARWRGVPSVSTREWYEGLREHWQREVCRLAPNTAYARAQQRETVLVNHQEPRL